MAGRRHIVRRRARKVENAGKEIKCVTTLYGNGRNKEPKEDGGKHGIKISAEGRKQES
jgi:hypothetical protein